MKAGSPTKGPPAREQPGSIEGGEGLGRQAFRQEFRSLLLVYIALAVLPLLTGFACQG